MNNSISIPEKNSKDNAIYMTRDSETIVFAQRVYDYAKTFVDTDPEKYFLYTRIAFENILEYLSLRYPKSDEKERAKTFSQIDGFLKKMSKDVHSYIHEFYSIWQKKVPALFPDLSSIIKKEGVYGFYPISVHHMWERTRINSDSINKDSEKYPKIFLDYKYGLMPNIDENSVTYALQWSYYLKNMFPTSGKLSSGLDEDSFSLPMVECDFSEEIFRKELSEKEFSEYKASKKDKDQSSILIQMRACPNLAMDGIGQFGDNYDLAVNITNGPMEYTACIVYSNQKAFSESSENNNFDTLIRNSIPAMKFSAVIHIPYPEILDLEMFEKSIPNALRYTKEGRFEISDKRFDAVLQNMKQKATQTKVDRDIANIKFFNDILKNSKDSKKRSFIFETPGVPWEFLFAPLENRQYKKIRTFFISLYRVGKNHYLTDKMAQMVREGVYVYAYVEPTARGDEKANQKLIKELERSGVHVIHSCNGLKVHMKAWLIIYEDNSMLSMISTGNYNMSTLSSYTDLHVITQDLQTNLELLHTFKVLVTGGDFKADYDWWNSSKRNIYLSPISLENRFIRSIENNEGDMFIKCNNISDKHITRVFAEHMGEYESVRMMIRTSCIVLPHYSGLEIRSKISKSLEHSRLYKIGTEYFISSADLMKRNFTKRVEILLKLPYYLRNVITTIHYMDTQSIDFDPVSLDEYIDSIWDSCNYRLDELTLRWKVKERR